MHCSENGPASLLIEIRSELEIDKSKPVLDLACGNGRNGLWLARQGFEVIFADRNATALAQLKSIVEREKLSATIWEVDLENAPPPNLGKEHFAAVLVFRYLHRPLFPMIKDALSQGGAIVYETFTYQQPQFGRPKNPHFLLRENELNRLFQDWQSIHTFEGIKQNPQCAVAQWVGYKPIKG